MKPIYLRTARDRKHWTQEQLEEQSGVAQAIISRLERTEEIRPLFDTVVKLAEALDVDPRQLRFGPDPQRQDRVSA